MADLSPMQKNTLFLLFLFLTLGFLSAPILADSVSDIKNELKSKNGNLPKHAIALHGEPKYPVDFEHLEYANPDAPKGGVLKLHATGTFDSLNPFIVKGEAAAGLNYLRSGLFYESLMQNSYDEPFSLYGIIAESITVPEDKSWAKFKLRDEARWSDGNPIIAQDVIWTFRALIEKGQPLYKAYWNDVESVEEIDEKTVIFKFAVRGNAELPLIVAELPILPKHYWSDEAHNIEETFLDVPVSSGPYKISKVVPGRSIEYTRNPDWWGKDLAFFKGMNNFDQIVYDYYRDENVAQEAFLARDYDVKFENVAKIWYEGYKVAPEKAKSLIKENVHNSRPAGMQAFIFNVRRPAFQDKNVRAALAYALDFEWSNKQFAYGDYIRTNSYYENSELSSCCNLPSEEELKILEPFKDRVPEEVFSTVYKAPVTDGSGKNRRNLREGIKLLEKAGYTQLDKDGVRYKLLEDTGNSEEDSESAQALEFEILHYSPTFERWVLPFVKNLERMGVKANFRVVDTAQFQGRVSTFDYDMLIGGFGQSESPGNEQKDFWGSDKADIQGSRNLIGVKDPVVDELIKGIIHAESREDLVFKTRALDRVLLWNHYIIPMWHYPKWRIAYWDSIKRPETLSGISPLITQSWWSAEAEQSVK